MKRAFAAIAATVVGMGSAVAWLALSARRGQAYGDATSPTFDVVVVAKGSRFVSRAEGFAGGTVLVTCGSLALDLREAQVDPTGAFIEIDAWFAAVSILVPRGCAVVVHGTTHLGGSVVAPGDQAGIAADAPAIEVEARAYGATVTIQRAI